jgi:hypothetical protein
MSDLQSQPLFAGSKVTHHCFTHTFSMLMVGTVIFAGALIAGLMLFTGNGQKVCNAKYHNYEDGWRKGALNTKGGICKDCGPSQVQAQAQSSGPHFGAVTKNLKNTPPPDVLQTAHSENFKTFTSRIAQDVQDVKSRLNLNPSRPATQMPSLF